MNGRDLTLASLASLAAVGAVSRMRSGSRDGASGWAYHVTGVDRLAAIARDGLRPHPVSGRGVSFVAHLGVANHPVDPARTAWLRFPWPAGARALPTDPGPSWARGWTMGDPGAEVEPGSIEILVEAGGRPVDREDRGTWVPLRASLHASLR